jgi:hypothetical protein
MIFMTFSKRNPLKTILGSNSIHAVFSCILSSSQHIEVTYTTFSDSQSFCFVEFFYSAWWFLFRGWNVTQGDVIVMVYWNFTEDWEKEIWKAVFGTEQYFQQTSWFSTKVKNTRYFKIVIRYSSKLLNSLLYPPMDKNGNFFVNAWSIKRLLFG